jgi:hypothetical protein
VWQPQAHTTDFCFPSCPHGCNGQYSHCVCSEVVSSSSSGNIELSGRISNHHHHHPHAGTGRPPPRPGVAFASPLLERILYVCTYSTLCSMTITRPYLQKACVREAQPVGNKEPRETRVHVSTRRAKSLNTPTHSHSTPFPQPDLPPLGLMSFPLLTDRGLHVRRALSVCLGKSPYPTYRLGLKYQQLPHYYVRTASRHENRRTLRLVNGWWRYSRTCQLTNLARTRTKQIRERDLLLYVQYCQYYILCNANASRHETTLATEPRLLTLQLARVHGIESHAASLNI